MLKILVGIAAALLLLASSMPTTAQPTDPSDISKEDFFNAGLAPVRKDAGYNLTIVYFMDYQCPACRQYTPDATRAFREDRGLRIIYRDTPIFGARSEAAARAAIASQFQGKHEPFHAALMSAPLPLEEDGIRAAAKKAGLDWPRLQADITRHANEIERQIETNMALSTAAGISGTPAFIIGNRLSDGALGYRDLKAEIADARAELGVSARSAAEATIEETKSEAAATPRENDTGPKAAATREAPHFERRAEDRTERTISSEAATAIVPAWLICSAVGVVLLSLMGWIAIRRSKN